MNFIIRGFWVLTEIQVGDLIRKVAPGRLLQPLFPSPQTASLDCVVLSVTQRVPTDGNDSGDDG